MNNHLISKGIVTIVLIASIISLTGCGCLAESGNSSKVPSDAVSTGSDATASDATGSGVYTTK